jgi:hypothetical protein
VIPPQYIRVIIADRTAVVSGALLKDVSHLCIQPGKISALSTEVGRDVHLMGVIKLQLVRQIFA